MIFHFLQARNLSELVMYGVTESVEGKRVGRKRAGWKRLGGVELGPTTISLFSIKLRLVFLYIISCFPGRPNVA